MENENIEQMEIESMRAQIALLKDKLSRETIISDKLLRETTKTKAKNINNIAWVSVFASIFVIFSSLTSFPRIGLSWWFCGGTIVMMLVCDVFTWQMHKNVNKKTLDGDLLTVAKIMRKLKQQYIDWLKYSIILVVAWFIWLSIEFWKVIEDWRVAAAMIGSALVGCIIGGFIGLKMHRNVVRNADEIIRQIEEDE